jgi:hypothetical protein
MGADGGKGPQPWVQHAARTTFLRVPVMDWPAVKRGVKTEFRANGGRGTISQAWKVPTPVPVVAYTIRQGRYDARLMILEEVWQEPLGAISPESLRREGFADMAEFRAYWLAREHVRFRPTRKMFAFRVRPWVAEDFGESAEKLLRRLYGDFLDESRAAA